MANYRAAARPCVNDSVQFHRALRKYGFDGFVWEIVEAPKPDSTMTIKEQRQHLLKREQHWIDMLSPFDPVGYNTAVTAGSSLASCRPNNRIPVVQIDKKTLAVVNTFNSVTEAAVACGLQEKAVTSISGACTGRTISCKGYFWAHKDAYDSKGFSPRKRSIVHLEKPIVQLTPDGFYVREWSSAAEAARILDCSASDIRHCCRGTLFSAKQHCWCYKQDYTKHGFTPNPEMIREKPVYQICKVTGAATVWKSAKWAEQCLGFDSASIQSCCIGRYKTANGFVWRYVNPKV